jgi:hypothetical protein
MVSQRFSLSTGCVCSYLSYMWTNIAWLELILKPYSHSRKRNFFLWIADVRCRSQILALAGDKYQRFSLKYQQELNSL